MPTVVKKARGRRECASGPFAGNSAASVVQQNAAARSRAPRLPRLPTQIGLTADIRGQRRKPRTVSFHDDISPLDVNQTPIRVTPSPANITIVSGSPNSAQAQIIVTGGLR